MYVSTGGIPECIKLYSEESPGYPVKGKLVPHSEPVFQNARPECNDQLSRPVLCLCGNQASINLIEAPFVCLLNFSSSKLCFVNSKVTAFLIEVVEIEVKGKLPFNIYNFPVQFKFIVEFIPLVYPSPALCKSLGLRK